MTNADKLQSKVAHTVYEKYGLPAYVPAQHAG